MLSERRKSFVAASILSQNSHYLICIERALAYLREVCQAMKQLLYQRDLGCSTEKEVAMLTSMKHDEWSLKEDKDRDYATEVEKTFFGAIDNPKPANEELKELNRAYGKYLRK